MLDVFLQVIEEIRILIGEPIDIRFKILGINKLKKKLAIDEYESFSNIYYGFVKNDKEKGVIYTPLEIANYMISYTINKEDIINNPYIKIIDPACGCGNLIVPCYNYLLKVYLDNLDEINNRGSLTLKEDNICKHIIDNNLFGRDIDEMALKILMIDLFVISKHVNLNNFLRKDFLVDEIDKKYDIYLSNPPYVGHKSVDREYSLKLKSLYKNVYKDKGDISYCFFQKAIINLNAKGKFTFITSRYFLESPSGEELRKILKELCSVYKIIDFYGIRPFKGAGIDPVIIFASKDRRISDDIEIIKPKLNTGKNKKVFVDSVFLNKGEAFNSFKINKSHLNDKVWVLRDEKERNIVNKIEKRSFTNLSNICNSYQGIITGCDKAFILKEEEIKEKNIEMELVKPWIKSSYIRRYKLNRGNSYIIYADLIKEENKYPNALKFIKLNEEKLITRRECIKGIRKWHELQWGRVQAIFEGEKIIFPFKANSNRFALDKGSYFSADVYSLILKENVPFSYEYLLYILNSKTYEFYFKTFAKKLGEDLYEYYPSNLMRLCIPTMIDFQKDDESYLYKLFNFSEEEVSIIENFVIDI